MRENLGTLSVGKLLDMLHQAISNAVHEIDRIVGINEKVGTREIEDLREHIEQRIKAGEDTKYNEEMVNIIDLFLTDKYVLEFIKEDSNEWLDFIAAIKKSAGEGGNSPESKKLYNSVVQLENMLRGS